MTGYVKGSSAQAEIEKIRESVARAGYAMLAWPDVLQAFEDAGKLGDLGREISAEASQFRAYLAARLVDDRGVAPSQLAQILDLTPARVSQLVKDGRKQRRNPMTDPGTLAEQPTVALAIVTAPGRGVLMEHRRDGIPEWTFPGGDVQVGETAAAALTRKVPAETGIEIKPILLFGRRVHPRTSRTMVYLAAEATGDSLEPQVLDTEDLDRTEWVSDLDMIRSRMPDMFPAVLTHLEAVLGGSGSTS